MHSRVSHTSVLVLCHGVYRILVVSDGVSSRGYQQTGNKNMHWAGASSVLGWLVKNVGPKLRDSATRLRLAKGTSLGNLGPIFFTIFVGRMMNSKPAEISISDPPHMTSTKKIGFFEAHTLVGIQPLTYVIKFK